MYTESLLVTEKVTCRGFQWKELWREVKDPWRTNSKLKQCKHSAFSAKKKKTTNIFSSFLTQFFFFLLLSFCCFCDVCILKKKKEAVWYYTIHVSQIVCHSNLTSMSAICQKLISKSNALMLNIYISQIKFNWEKFFPIICMTGRHLSSLHLC